MPFVANFVVYAVQAYILLIIVYVLGSWFPQWKGRPWYRLVEDIVGPYLNLFRRLPLQMGMIDLAPMAAIFVLILFETLVRGAAGGM